MCGNYLNDPGAGGAKQDAAQLYAGGADTTCLRAALSVAACRDWSAAALDVKTAFLNAPLCLVEDSKKKKLLAMEDRAQEEDVPGKKEAEEEADPNRRERLVLMQPPRILVRLVYVDDLLVLGDPEVVEAATTRIGRTWEHRTSIMGRSRTTTFLWRGHIP